MCKRLGKHTSLKKGILIFPLLMGQEQGKPDIDSIRDSDRQCVHQLGALVCRQCLTFCGVGCKGSKIFSLKFLCQLILKKSETRTSFLYGSSYLCLGNAAPSHVALGSQPSTWSVSAQRRPESPSRWQQLLVSRLRSWAAAPQAGRAGHRGTWVLRTCASLSHWLPRRAALLGSWVSAASP